MALLAALLFPLGIESKYLYCTCGTIKVPQDFFPLSETQSNNLADTVFGGVGHSRFKRRTSALFLFSLFPSSSSIWVGSLGLGFVHSYIVSITLS